MTAPVRVASVMHEIDGDVRERLRRRLVDRGLTAYADPQTFERVVALLQRAADGRGPDALLLPALLADDADWALEPNVRISSHRPVIGPLIVFAKQWLVLPLTRWLFEYSQANFRRQQMLNRTLIACIEELAIENARLRRDLDARR